MKKPNSGERILIKLSSRIFLIGFFLLVGLCLVCFFPDLKNKEKILGANRTVGIAVDWQDLKIISYREKSDLHALLASLRKIPVDYVVLPFFTSEKEIDLFRTSGFHIFWTENEQGKVDTEQFSKQFYSGDGVLPGTEAMFGYPRTITEVGQLIETKHGLFPIVEFGPTKGLRIMSRVTKNHWVKTHVLHAEEVLGSPKFSLWSNRIGRAVRERDIRLIVLSLSPEASFNQSLEFLHRIHSRLLGEGFTLGNPLPQTFERSRALAESTRLELAFFLALAGPIVGCALIKKNQTVPILVFITVTALSVLEGVAIHSLGCFPSSLMGLAPMIGVKFLLVFPLFVSGVLLLTPEEIKKLLNNSLTIKEILWGGGILVGLLGLYLIRSGNFPTIAVTDSERTLRNYLDQWFWVRPRFKEFLIGHPFLILGLTLRNLSKNSGHFIRDGRLFILIGLIGQISIMNTYQHFSAPVLMGTVRSLHGIWIGFLLAIPLTMVMKKFQRQNGVR